MHWNTLKIATVVALLASPSAFAALPGAGAIDGRADAVAASQPLQLADHRGHPGRRSDHWSNNGRRGGGRGDHNYGRPPHRPHYDGRPPHRYRGHPPHHYRGHRPRHFRGIPLRRLFRHWRRHH